MTWWLCVCVRVCVCVCVSSFEPSNLLVPSSHLSIPTLPINSRLITRILHTVASGNVNRHVSLFKTGDQAPKRETTPVRWEFCRFGLRWRATCGLWLGSRWGSSPLWWPPALCPTTRAFSSSRRGLRKRTTPWGAWACLLAPCVRWIPPSKSRVWVPL